MEESGEQSNVSYRLRNLASVSSTIKNKQVPVLNDGGRRTQTPTLARKDFQKTFNESQISEAKDWLEKVFSESYGNIEEFPDKLIDGVILCDLLMKLSPELKIKYSKKPKLAAGSLNNIQEFLNICKEWKIKATFNGVDLYEKRNIPGVISCIHELATIFTKKGFQPPFQSESGFFAAHFSGSRDSFVQSPSSTPGSNSSVFNLLTMPISLSSDSSPSPSSRFSSPSSSPRISVPLISPKSPKSPIESSKAMTAEVKTPESSTSTESPSEQGSSQASEAVDLPAEVVTQDVDLLTKEGCGSEVESKKEEGSTEATANCIECCAQEPSCLELPVQREIENIPEIAEQAKGEIEKGTDINLLHEADQMPILESEGKEQSSGGALEQINEEIKGEIEIEITEDVKEEIKEEIKDEIVIKEEKQEKEEKEEEEKKEEREGEKEESEEEEIEIVEIISITPVDTPDLHQEEEGKEKGEEEKGERGKKEEEEEEEREEKKREIEKEEKQNKEEKEKKSYSLEEESEEEESESVEIIGVESLTESMSELGVQSKCIIETPRENTWEKTMSTERMNTPGVKLGSRRNIEESKEQPAGMLHRQNSRESQPKDAEKEEENESKEKAVEWTGNNTAIPEKEEKEIQETLEALERQKTDKDKRKGTHGGKGKGLGTSAGRKEFEETEEENVSVEKYLELLNEYKKLKLELLNLQNKSELKLIQNIDENMHRSNTNTEFINLHGVRKKRNHKNKKITRRDKESEAKERKKRIEEQKYIKSLKEKKRKEQEEARKAKLKDKNQLQRLCVLQEILNTEKDYVSDLQIIIKVKKSLENEKIINQQESGLIFSNVEQLSMIHQEIATKLDKSLLTLSDEECWNSSIGEIFLKLADFLKIYTVYVSNQSNQVKTIESFSHHRGFINCLLRNVTEFEMKDLIFCDLHSYLIKPVQRICKYPLLLKELLRFTDDLHEDKANLEKAYHQLQSITMYINEKKKESENYIRLLTVQNTILDLPKSFNLIQPHRSLIRHGPLVKISKGRAQERIFYLLSDWILYGSKSVLKTNKIHLKGKIPLNMLLVNNLSDKEDLKNAFELVRIDHKKKKYIICSKDQKEKQSWIEDIQKLVFHMLDVERGLKPKPSLNSSSLSSNNSNSSDSLVPIPSPSFAHAPTNAAPSSTPLPDPKSAP